MQTVGHQINTEYYLRVLKELDYFQFRLVWKAIHDSIPYSIMVAGFKLSYLCAYIL